MFQCYKDHKHAHFYLFIYFCVVIAVAIMCVSSYPLFPLVLNILRYLFQAVSFSFSSFCWFRCFVSMPVVSLHSDL